MLLCPVRDCYRPLLKQGEQLSCERGHSFDVARSGYVNLLQPQDKRSKHPGDARAAVSARRRLHDRGLSRPLFKRIAEVAAATSNDIALDAGCGDGFYLGTLARGTGLQAHGVDISIPAIDAAARRYPNCEWIVANADRWIPFSDLSFSLVLSITARLNHLEFRRVLRDDGRLLIALPAPDDLVELRGEGRDRVDRTLTDFEPSFQLLRKDRVTASAELDPAAIQDVRVSIYRPGGVPPPANMQVTFSLDLLLFSKR